MRRRFQYSHLNLIINNVSRKPDNVYFTRTHSSHVASVALARAVYLHAAMTIVHTTESSARFAYPGTVNTAYRRAIIVRSNVFGSPTEVHTARSCSAPTLYGSPLSIPPRRRAPGRARFQRAARERSADQVPRSLLDSYNDDGQDKYETAVGHSRSGRFQRGFPALQPRPITAAARRVAYIADAIITYASLASDLFVIFSNRKFDRVPILVIRQLASALL